MFLGLDLGTSGLKGVIIDDEQAVVAEASAPLSVSRPREGWSEQDPQTWICAAETVLASLAGQMALSQVQGIGLSGQMHGATLLDRHDTPLRPAILWNDTRAHKEAETLDRLHGVRQVTGNMVFPGFTAPKLMWVKTHEPAVFDKINRVLLPKDFLRLWLTGEAVTDPSDASGTSWLDVAQRSWSEAMLSSTDLTLAAMPRLVEGPAVSAQVRGAIAERFGLTTGTVVAAGAGDNAATAIGMGVIRQGQAFLSLGTSGVLFAPSDRFRSAPQDGVHSFCHALPNCWHQMGVILSAADALAWLGRLLGDDPATLVASIQDAAPPGRALFLPYLGGERTPHNDASVRAALVGLSHESDRKAATRAVMEGVAFAVRDCRDALAATGITIEHAFAVGGGARSDGWLSIIASVLGIAIAVPAGAHQGAAFGAARLGFMAATGAGEEALASPAAEKTIIPNHSLADAMDRAHERYRALYAAVKNLS